MSAICRQIARRGCVGGALLRRRSEREAHRLAMLTTGPAFPAEIPTENPPGSAADKGYKLGQNLEFQSYGAADTRGCRNWYAISSQAKSTPW